MALEKKLSKAFVKAMATYRLIEDGDKILVGLSGGKDSLCLLELLAKRSRINFPKFCVEAIHIRMENVEYESDTTYLEDFAEELGVRLHIITTGFSQSDKKPPCFLCSWNRRKQMFNYAQQNGFNKIALGHHQDDIIHTALMNMIFQGHFSTMPARLKMRKMPLTIIRPLCMIHEDDIIRYATLSKYKKQNKLCPFEEQTHRQEIKELYKRIENINPEARYSIWNALDSERKLTEDIKNT